MVMRYDAISSRWSSHFWVKMHAVSTFFRNKSKPVDKMMQSNYLCVILHVQRKKLFILTVFTWFLINPRWWLWDLQQHHHPWNIPHLVEKIKGFPLKAKLFQNIATYQKLKGKGGPSPPPPPSDPLVPRRGYGFNCTSEGKGTCMSNTTYWENSQTVVFTAATNNTVIKLLVNIEDNN